MRFVINKSLLILSGLVGFTIPVLFQNCSGVNFKQYMGEVSSVTSESMDNCIDPKCADIPVGLSSCTFNGQTIHSGDTIEAFRESQGEVCVSESRRCLNGSLSGTYQYASCTEVKENGEEPSKRSCLFGSQTIAHGQSVNAYQNSSVSFGEECVSEERVCTDGSLSGSYQFSTCQADQPDSCIFNGETIQHGSVVWAYQNSSVPFGEECVKELRLCTNGSLNGSYQYSSCETGAPNSCLFQGTTIPHLGSKKAYQNSSVGFGETCVSQDRVCTNGVLSGSYNHLSCETDAPKSCTFDGKDVAHGQSVRAFKNSSVPFGETCVEESRVCENGALSGSFEKPSCNIGEPLTCSFNGKDIAHGQIVKAFKTSSVSYGDTCESEDRVCTNGNLSGSYSFEACTPGSPKSCQFNGQTIAHGQKVIGFHLPSVPFGSQCQSEERVCSDGVLSGSAAHSSCLVGNPAHCVLNGQTIAHGQSRAVYQSSSVPFGSSCKSQTRTCNDGKLSGSYTNLSCSVQSAPSPTYSWKTSSYGSCQGTWQTSSFGSCQATSCTQGIAHRSVTCSNTGTQNREVYCQRNDGVRVTDSYCSGSKPTAVRSCSNPSCSAGAKPSESSSCTPSNVCRYSLTAVRTVSGSCTRTGTPVGVDGNSCSSAGSTRTVHWKGANGSYTTSGEQCVSPSGAPIKNTYRCEFCPSGRWTKSFLSVKNDINNHSGGYMRTVCAD